MRLYVARHGETTLNQQHKFYGSKDPVLTEKGVSQAEALADKVTDIAFDILVRSDTKRTQQTLKPIQQQHLMTPVKILPQLNEKGFGKWEDLNADEIELADPINWQRWLDEPLSFTPPSVESFTDFTKRVQVGLDQVLMLPSNQVFLMAHQGTLRVIHQLLIPAAGDFWSLSFDAGYYSVYDIESHRHRLVEHNQ